MVARRANGSPKMNVSRANVLQSHQCWDRQDCARKKDDLARKDVSNCSHQGRSNEAAARLEL